MPFYIIIRRLDFETKTVIAVQIVEDLRSDGISIFRLSDTRRCYIHVSSLFYEVALSITKTLFVDSTGNFVNVINQGSVSIQRLEVPASAFVYILIEELVKTGVLSFRLDLYWSLRPKLNS